LLSQHTFEHQGDDVDNMDNDRDDGNRHRHDHDRDVYWTGVNPAIPAARTNSNNIDSNNNDDNGNMVMVVARNNRTHEQVT
jgi:hypothetical protein